MNESIKLIEEIRQIKVQYRAEVNGVRKQWPRAIKARIHRLFDLDLSSQKIANETGISFHTVSSWKSKHKNRELFHQLPVSGGNTKKILPSKSSTVTVTKTGESLPSIESVTVTVTTPSGYKIEGLNFSQLSVFLKKIGASECF